MKKIETHLHCAPIAGCAIETPRDIIRLYKTKNYDAIICTNHVNAWFLDCLACNKNPVEEYMNAFAEMKKYGEKSGIDVWFGIEVNLAQYAKDGKYLEFLLHGIDPSFLEQNPEMYNYTQKELYEKVKAAGGLMIQSHPYRSHCFIADVEYLDGFEAYNYHPHHTQPTDEFVDFAKSTGKILLSGSDFHFRGGEGLGGMLVPDGVSDSKGFVESLKNGTAQCIIRED